MVSYFFTLVCSFFITACIGQEYQGLIEDDNNLLKINGDSFDDWVSKQAIRFKKSPFNPDTVSAYLYLRLKQKRYVSTKAVRQCLTMNRQYGLVPILDSLKKDTNYDDFSDQFKFEKKYLLAISPHINERERLQKELELSLSSIYFEEGNFEEYLKIQEKIVSFSEALGNEMQLNKVSALNRLGNYYFNNNDHEEAEKYYLDALSYRWTLVMNQELRAKFKKQYLHAGKNLLHCRKDNLEKLKNTTFFRSVRNVLDPIKQQYIESIEKK